MSALDDRRQSSREAYYDGHGEDLDCLDECIEVATRVRITREVMAAAGAGRIVPPGVSRRRALTIIFQAAGFEVVE